MADVDVGPGLQLEANDPAQHSHTLADLKLDSGQLLTLAQRLGYAAVPGMGNFQNDTVAVNDSVDTGFPLFIDFVLPGNLTKLQVIKLSFKPRAFRSYVNTSLSGSTGAGTSHQHANAGAESGHTHSHSHSHGHTLTVTPSQTGIGNLVAMSINDTGIGSTNAGTTSITTNGDATSGSGSSTGHSHAGNTGTELSHTHPAAGVITFQIQESTGPAAIHIGIDGSPTDGTTADLTVKLGGPWSGLSEVVELDLTPYVLPKTGQFHTITLTSSQLGRIMAYLRVTSIVNPFAA